MSSPSNSDTNNNSGDTNLKNDVKILPKDDTSAQNSTKPESFADLKRNSIVLPLSGIVLTDAYPKYVKSFEEILEDLGITYIHIFYFKNR